MPSSSIQPGSLRLGLCCTFLLQPIRFRTTTARYASGLGASDRRALLRRLALENADALARAIDWCASSAIGAFRINSRILPLYTHPQLGYRLEEIDVGGEIVTAFESASTKAKLGDVRLSFHPDQFVVLGSAREDVVRSSIDELEYQSMMADLVGADQLTLHGGGAAGGKEAALERLRRNLARLSGRARARIALENDDRIYTVQDLLPVCAGEGLPLVYDVHHHRCHPDGLSVEEATFASAATWGSREPWAHLSSPEGGWKSGKPRTHADYVSPRDVPGCWLGRRMTVDVEAKAKELAVLRLASWLRRSERAGGPRPEGAR